MTDTLNPTPDSAQTDRLRPPPADLLQTALLRLLRPLVRLAIGSGVTFPMLADLLRGLYIDVARHDLPKGERTQTDSRISLLTGVHRKELRRQRIPEAAPEPPAVTLSSQVIGRWLGSPALTGTDGRPLPLPRLGPAPSFEALVSGVTRDIRPRALLDAWLDQGIAALDEDGRVRLENAAYVPQTDRETQVYFFARNLHDHVAAACANVAAPETPPFLERAVHYDGLSEAAAAEIAEVARQAAAAALLEVNRRALAIADADDLAYGTGDDGRAKRRFRVNVGAYLFWSDENRGAEGQSEGG